MCRMLIAAGEFDKNVLFDSFLKMAMGLNERHERNEDKIFNHPDGWGIAYIDNGVIKKYKKEVPAWEDKAFEKYRSINSRIILLHARRSSATKRLYENTQPFYRKMSGAEYVFCHNGTINEELDYDAEFYPLGDTDSEMFFYYVLTALTHRGEDSLAESLAAISEYTAANIILMSKDTACAAVQYSHRPKYYTMKLYYDNRCVIISSERLPGFHSIEWQPLANMTLVKIDLQTLDYELEHYGND